VGKCWNISGDSWKSEVYHPLLMHHQFRIRFAASVSAVSFLETDLYKSVSSTYTFFFYGMIAQCRSMSPYY
jgi:hypothetical protein